MAKIVYLFMCSIIALTSFQAISAVTCEVINNAPNHPGGIRFEKEVGAPYTKQIMGTINTFIFKIFQRKSPGERRNQDVVRVFIHEYDGGEAMTIGENINVSSIFLQGYPGDLKWKFTSLLYHEMTHVFQWIPPQAPNGLIEGVADYVMLKAHYAQDGFAKPGEGDRWDQGYNFTARFLEFCDGLKKGFTAQLNKKMKDTYSDDYFVEMLGKSVDKLWKQYKDKYRV